MSKRPLGWLGLPAMMICLLPYGGCGSGESCKPFADGSVLAVFRSDPGAVTAFPSDQYTVPADRPTGRRLNVTDEDVPLLAAGMSALMSAEKLAEILNGLDGFSTWAPVLVPLSGPVDGSTLPATPEDSVAEGSSVFLVAFDPEPGLRIPVAVTAVQLQDGKDPEHLLVVQPQRPLKGGTFHALVITGAVRAVDGTPLSATGETALLVGRCGESPAESDPLYEMHQKLAPLFTGAAAVDSLQVALALPFTTQSIGDRQRALREAVRATTPAADFDDDGDGSADLYALAELPRGSNGFAKAEFIGGVARGRFESPSFRDTDGIIRFDDQRRPIQTGTERIPFILVYPAAASAQPYPLVVLQHGHGAQKEIVLPLAGHLAERGIASVAVDLVEHGERPSTGHNFLDFSSLQAVRANFEQTSADQMRLVQLLGTLGDLDLFPGGTGDGKADLDPAKLAYAGQSLGAMAAPAMAALESIDPMVLNVGGGSFSDLLGTYAVGVLDERTLLELKVLSQTVFDGPDPINHTEPFRAGSTSPDGRQVLMQEVIDDNTMPNLATEDLARALEVPLLRPYAREIPGLVPADTPALGWGLYQYDPTYHGFLFDTDPQATLAIAARAQITTYIDSSFSEGRGRIESITP